MAHAPRRILVKQVNWLGDIVMSQPALRALRRAYPAAHLAVLVKRELASFFDGATWIDEVIPYRIRPGWAGLGDQRTLVADLRRRRFDLAVLFPDSFQSALWAAAAGIPERVGYVRDLRGLLLTRGVAPTETTQAGHQVGYRLHLLSEALGIAGSPDDFAVDVAPLSRVRMQAWLGERRRRPDGPLIGLAAGAAYGPAKEWPATRFAALADLLAERLGAECVLVGSPGERARSEEVAAATRAGALVAAGATDVGELVALLSLCAGFVGNDSGSMHVAGALGVPTVGIFGSTRPGRTAPLGGRATVVYHAIECSPCLKRTCRFGHYRCLTEIDAPEVARALEDGMGR
jgi:heptosyltransferase-2